MPEETTAKNYTPANLKKVRVLAPPMVSNVGLRRQLFQIVLTTPILTDASPSETVKHERRDVGLLLEGCRLTKIEAQLYGDANTTKRTFL